MIGAGLGGLVCAGLLARRGFRVTVLEQARSVGGYATAFNRGPFRFETSLHAAALGDTPMQRLLANLGVYNRVRFIRLPELHRIVTPAYDVTFPAADPMGYARVLARDFPSERKGIRAFVNQVTGVADDVLRFNLGGDRVTPLFPFQYPAMWSTRDKTLADLMGEHVRHPECKALMSPLWCYYGLPPSRLSGFFYSAGTGQYLLNGAFYPLGRSQDISDALMEAIESRGGEVRTKSRVERITLANGRAASVSDASGRTFPADIVVSNISPEVTFECLLDDWGLSGWRQFRLGRFRRRLARFNPSLSSLTVWLGLNRDITDQIKEAEVFLAPGHDPEEDYRASLESDPDRALIGVMIYDNVYPDYSPPGKSTISVMFLSGFKPWERFADAYFRGDKEAYRQEKERIADRLIARVDRELIPGLSRVIERREVGTPLTNIRYTGNSDGAIYGYEQALHNTFYRRIDARTPIPNLYLASAWGNPGGGFAGATRAGQIAFNRIVKDHG